ncbi:MAG: hypothetical protein HY840_00115 [Bacteroidetes bacterium]|nr:hypothetical protein [Bacteroidota bacterium]
MKTIFSHLKVFSAVVFIIALVSCGSNKEDENNPVPQDTAKTVALKDTNSAAQNFFYSLPSPLVMARVFKKTGLKYEEGVANSPDNVSKYTSIQSKTLNLGVYSADLAYAILNKQSQPATKYMEAVKHLSDDLGMSTLFSTENYLKRFKNNIDKEDSLMNIVSELKKEMDMFMRDNETEKQTLLIFVGAWTENMYIATQITKEVNKEKIAMRVAEQKYILNNLMNVITTFQNDNEFKDLYLKLNELKALFDKLTVQGEEEKIIMDELQLKAITEKTRDLRKIIVG